MKGCLKQSSRAPSPDSHSHHHHHHNLKSVAFGTEEQVFVADEWDRTPAEPSRNLSYQDILELKEIQRSLPLAAQPADLISGRPASHYLKTVPIGLLPLLPETDSSITTPTTSTSASNMTVSASSWRTVRTPSPANPIATHSSWHPAHLSHLPAGRPPMRKEKPRFAFLPLLESQSHPHVDSAPVSPVSPPPSERSNSPFPDDSDVSFHDPPTPSLTNASLDSSPLSRASSCSPEPSYFQLNPTRKFGAWLPIYSDEHNANIEDVDIGEGERYAQPGAMFSSSRSNSNSSPAGRGGMPITSPTPKPTSKKVKKKNVIVVNDIEIELDGDDDDDEDECESHDNKDDKDQWRENEDISLNTPPAKSPSIPTLSLGSASPTPAPSIPKSNMNMFIDRPTSPTPSSPTPSSHAPISFKRSVPPPSSSSLMGMTMSMSCSPKVNTINTGGSNGGVLVPSA